MTCPLCWIVIAVIIVYSVAASVGDWLITRRK
jgi:hypothetical protein